MVPKLSRAKILDYYEVRGKSPAWIAKASGVPESEIISELEAECNAREAQAARLG